MVEWLILVISFQQYIISIDFFHFVGILPSSPDKTCLHLWNPMSNPSSPEEVTLGKNLVGELPAVPSIGYQVLTVFAPPLQSHRPGKVIQSQ